jgi:hypothetical protein
MIMNLAVELGCGKNVTDTIELTATLSDSTHVKTCGHPSEHKKQRAEDEGKGLGARGAPRLVQQ